MIRTAPSAASGPVVADARAWGSALLAHTCFGLYVVLLKYLTPILPPFSLLAAVYGVGMLAMFLAVRRHLDWAGFRVPAIWLLSAIMAVRSLSKLAAVHFTLATYV